MQELLEKLQQLNESIHKLERARRELVECIRLEYELLDNPSTDNFIIWLMEQERNLLLQQQDFETFMNKLDSQD